MLLVLDHFKQASKKTMTWEWSRKDFNRIEKKLIRHFLFSIESESIR